MLGLTPEAPTKQNTWVWGHSHSHAHLQPQGFQNLLKQDQFNFNNTFIEFNTSSESPELLLDVTFMSSGSSDSSMPLAATLFCKREYLCTENLQNIAEEFG